MKISLPQPILQSRRTRLRPLSVSDMRNLLILHNDPATRFFAWVEHLQDEESISDWLEEQKEQYNMGLGLMGVESLVNHEFLGLCGLRLRRDLDNAVDISYRIMPDKRNQGIATETAAEMVHHGFDALGLTEIVAQVHKNNFPSRRIMYRLGFAFDPSEGREKWLMYRKQKLNRF